MAQVNEKLTESVIKQIMEGADPRAAIDAALDEKAGYHKEKRIRGGKAKVVNVKNTKRKVHHVLTPAQKKAIKKAHSAQANKKRARSLKKGSKMGLYKEDVNIVAEAEAEEVGIVIPCPSCENANLEIFADPDGEETDGIVLVCPECGETFVICSTSEIDEDDGDADDDADDKEEEQAEEAAEEEVPQDESAEVSAEAPVSEEAPVAEECGGDDAKECGGEEAGECGGDGQEDEDSGLFFEAE